MPLLMFKAPIQSLLSVMRGLSASEVVLRQTLSTYNSLTYYSTSEENDDLSEAASDAEIIQMMVKDCDSAPIIWSRILCIIHNIPTRMFRAFDITKFNLEPLTSIPHYEAKEDEKRLIELLQKLTELSSHLVCSALKLSYLHF